MKSCCCFGGFIHPLVCYTFNWIGGELRRIRRLFKSSLAGWVAAGEASICTPHGQLGTRAHTRPRGRRIAAENLGQCQSITSTFP